MPTVLPSLGATLTPQQLQFASVHNGFLMKDATGAWLGGAQGFTRHLVRGAAGRAATAPTSSGRARRRPARTGPTPGAAEHRQWRVVLRRGQRSWVILSHHWAGEEEHRPRRCRSNAAPTS